MSQVVIGALISIFREHSPKLEFSTCHLLAKISPVQRFCLKNGANNKNTIKKAKDNKTGTNMALKCLRNTPIDHSLPSPAELLYT